MIQVLHGRATLCSKGLKLVTCVSSLVVHGSEPGQTSSIKELSQEDVRFAATDKLQARQNKRDSLELIRRPCSEQLAWTFCTAPGKHVASDLDFRFSQRSKSEEVQENTLELGFGPGTQR